MIYALVGPTASGKSSCALEIAKKNGAIIINADAFQVYKGMDIGTAKPLKKELEEVPHYLYDIFLPNHEFSIFEYQKLLRKTLEEHESENILLVGGSGLYLKSALYDFILEENSSYDMKQYEDYSNEELYQELLKVDEEAAKKIHPNNRKRTMRALEIYLSTGERKSEIENKQEHKPIYDVTFVGLSIPREELYTRINERVDDMVLKGLFEEVQELLKTYEPNLKAFQAIGYKEIIEGIQSGESKEAIIERIKKNSRHYAKRQMTYFEHQFEVCWSKTREELIAKVQF